MTILNNLIYDSISDDIVKVAEKIVLEEGAKNVTVRRILSEMDVTNRVFYNRFHNIDEVLEIIYKKAVSKMQESLKSEYNIETDFYNYVLDVSVKVLLNTYDVKNQFSQYMFELDSYTDTNRIWWTNKIKKMIDIGRATNQIKDIDSDMLSYTMWCFLRGYNADAVNRKLSKEDAVNSFKLVLGCLLDGLMMHS